MLVNVLVVVEEHRVLFGKNRQELVTVTDVCINLIWDEIYDLKKFIEKYVDEMNGRTFGFVRYELKSFNEVKL